MHNVAQAASSAGTRATHRSGYIDKPAGNGGFLRQLSHLSYGNCVNWYEAFAFCIWDDGGRLPTEAEWEYAAARGGENRLYPWGNEDPGTTRANYAESDHSPRIPVGSYQDGAGAFGHQDLAGSIWEWVFDWYYDKYYESVGNLCNNCANADAATARGLRGGGWFNDAILLRDAHRHKGTPSNSDQLIGIRCARNAQ